MTIDFDADAREELFRAAEFYEARRDGYGAKFVWALEQAASRAARTPAAGSRWPGAPPEPAVRRRRVPGFPAVALAYTVFRDRLLVLAVVHERQRPGFWLERLEKLRT